MNKIITCILLFYLFLSGCKEPKVPEIGLTLKESVESQPIKLINFNLRSDEGINLVQNILEDKSLIIFLSNTKCGQCADREIKLIKSIVKDNIDKVCIVGYFNSNRERKLFQDNCGIKTFQILDRKDFFSGIKRVHNYMFIYNKNLTGVNVLDITENPLLSVDYYKWFDKNIRNFF